VQLPPITPLTGTTARPFARSIHAAPQGTGYAAFRLFNGDEPPALSVKDQVAVTVAERIVERRLAPGARVPEQQIADEFGISKAPVSEALLQLEHVGLVESSSRRSAFVTRVAIEDFNELMEYRAPLACVYLARFFDRHGSADRKFIRENLQAMEATVDDDALSFAFSERGDRSSVYMALQAGNQRIARTIAAHSLQLLRYYHIGEQTLKQRRHTLAVRRELVRALEARDRDAFLARCEQIQQLRIEETLAALQAAAARPDPAV
jgi:DNA-binding GntR family transcriptional regulator